MGNYNYQIVSWPARPRSKKRREANISGGGTISSGGGGGMSDLDLSGYIRVADLIKTTSETSESDFLDTNALSSLMVKSLLDQKANTIHDHASQLIRPAVMVVPQQDPSDAGFSLSSGEIAEFISHEGSFAEEASSVTPADLKDLVLKINGVTKTTYNPASAASFNVDLTSYATQSWVQQQGYLTSFTESDPTVPAWAKAASKPSYSWSEIGSKPNSLSGYGITDGTPKIEAIPYIVGPSSDETAGTWTGSYTGIIELTEGLTIIYVPAVAGASTTTLNINGLGAKTCYYSGTNKLTTHYPVGTPILLTYHNNGWRRADYNSNTTYSAGTKDLFDAGANTTNRVWSASVLASAVAAKEHSHLWADITDSPSKLSDFTNDIISSWALAATKPSYSWSEIGSRPTKLSQFTNDIISSWALTATKPSYTLDEVTDGSSRKLSNYVLKAGDTMTGNLVVPSVRAANTYYGISFGRSNATPVETILYTGIKWATSSHMPVLHITGFAYGLQSPVEFKIGFYIYSNKIGWCGVTNMGSWAPQVYLFKYTNTDSIDCVAVGLAGSCYFLQLQADVQDEMGKFANIIVDRDKWSWSFQTTTGTIPAADGGTTCIAVPYKADILSLAWSKVTGKPTSLSGYGITDGYSSLSTTGNGNAITSVSGSGHALTFTKGNTFVDLASEQTISGKKHISYLDVTGAFAIPQVEPSAEAGKVFEYISTSGEFGGSDSAVTPADLKDLTLKINGVTKTTYNPASAASFNVDLTDYATQSWVEAKNYLQGITKAMVEAVLTGNITSHTHSQYLTAHQSLSNYYTKAQADAKFLTSHQSLADYALKSEIPTSMAWTAITDRPTKLSQFTNDIISSWALAASKPSYSWSEITSRPTALSAFTEDSTHRLVTDSQISAWNRSYGELILGTQTAATGSWTGVSSLATASDMTSGYRFTYWLPYAGSGNATLTLTFGDGTTKTFNLYLRGASRLTTHFPAGSKIDFVYLESVSVAGSSTKYTGAWPDAYYDTTYSAGTKALFDAGTNTTNRVWSASVLASAVAAKEHSHLWADITDCPSKLSDFTNDLISSWALAATKPSYTLDEVTDGSTRKLSNYVPTTRTINSKALSGNITLTLDDIANGTNRSLANYLPLSGGTLTGYVTFDTSSDKSIYANNGTLNQRMMLMSNSGNLSIGFDLPGNSKYLYLDGYQTYLRFGSSKNYSMTLWSDGTIRSSTGTNMLSIGYRSGNTIYPFKNVYSTINVSTKCAGTMGGTMLYGVARFAIQNTKKARTFAIKIPSSMGAYVTFKIVLYSSYNLSPSSTITVSAGAFNLTAAAYCALYPSCAIEGSFAGRVAFARDGNTSSANMYILLGSCNDTDALYQGGMIAIDSIIHADNIANADTIMNFGYELLDLDSESMFTKITECVNADAHFKSVTVEDHVTAPKIDCTSMMLVPTIEPSSVPAGKVAEYIDLTGSFAN